MTPLDFQDTHVQGDSAETQEARGEARGEARLLLRMLDQRGIKVDLETHAQIVRCRNVALLEHWFDRAITATTLDDVLTEPDNSDLFGAE